MRTFSSNVAAALAEDYVEYFFLIELNLNSNFYMTTHSSDISVEDEDGNTQLFSGNGTIFDYEPPSNNSVVDREAYSISLVDPNHTLLTQARQGIVGKPVSIRAGFVHPTLGPLTSSSDLVYVYKGYVDAPTISNDFDSKIMKLECSSPMADLDAVKPFFTTKYGVAQYDDSDTTFDRIYDGYALQLKWGKT